MGLRSPDTAPYRRPTSAASRHSGEGGQRRGRPVRSAGRPPGPRIGGRRRRVPREIRAPRLPYEPAREPRPGHHGRLRTAPVRRPVPRRARSSSYSPVAGRAHRCVISHRRVHKPEHRKRKRPARHDPHRQRKRQHLRIRDGHRLRPGGEPAHPLIRGESREIDANARKDMRVEETAASGRGRLRGERRAARARRRRTGPSGGSGSARPAFEDEAVQADTGVWGRSPQVRDG